MPTNCLLHILCFLSELGLVLLNCFVVSSPMLSVVSNLDCCCICIRAYCEVSGKLIFAREFWSTFENLSF